MRFWGRFAHWSCEATDAENHYAQEERAKGGRGGGGPSGLDEPPKRRSHGRPAEAPSRRSEADAEAEQLHPEVAEFVRWFTSWWLTRGLELVEQEEAEERRAA